MSAGGGILRPEILHLSDHILTRTNIHHSTLIRAYGTPFPPTGGATLGLAVCDTEHVKTMRTGASNKKTLCVAKSDSFLWVFENPGKLQNLEFFMGFRKSWGENTARRKIDSFLWVFENP